MFSDRGVYLHYHHMRVGVQVVYNNSIAWNQVSILFLQNLSFTIKFCVTSYGMTKTANENKLLNNDTSRNGKGFWYQTLRKLIFAVTAGYHPQLMIIHFLSLFVNMLILSQLCQCFFRKCHNQRYVKKITCSQ